MRDILFRAKRIDNGEWVEGNLILTPKADEDFKAIIIPFDDNGEYTEGVNDNDLGFETWYKVDMTTICQYTGLTDKNGNKIWENDVVEYRDCTNEKYVVAWEASKAMFEHQQYSCSIMNFDELSGMEIEVIGNIFDNAELLEG